MLTIRLQRTGSKNRATFRIVLAEAHKAAGKKFLEVLGSYDPRSKKFAIKDEARVKYWLGQHVQVSPSVHNLFVDKKLMEAKKVKAWKPKKSAVSQEGEAAPASEGTSGAPAEAAPSAEGTPETPTAAPTETPAA
jgi:small subunit ribosomal protein S16